jgi:O-antigen ligase
MLMLFPLAYKLWQAKADNASRLERYFLVLLWVAPILTILGSSSRGAQIALALQSLLIFRRSIFRFKNLIVIAILSISAYQLLPNEQKERFDVIGEDKSSEQRMLYWKNGLTMIKEHPFFGVGYYNFIPYYNDQYPDDVLYNSAELAHNIFIQVGADAGIVGLIFFVFIIIKSLRLAFNITKDTAIDNLGRHIAAGLAYGIIGFVIAGQFVSVAYYPFIWISAAQVVALWNTYKTTTPAPIRV